MDTDSGTQGDTGEAMSSGDTGTEEGTTAVGAGAAQDAGEDIGMEDGNSAVVDTGTSKDSSAQDVANAGTGGDKELPKSG